MKIGLILGGLLMAALVQTGLVGKMITDRAAMLREGAEVRLETGFVDPRDLFRGHYVTLRLMISTVSNETVEIPNGLTSNQEVWVALGQDNDGFWRARSVMTEPRDGVVALKGEVGWLMGPTTEGEDAFRRLAISRTRRVIGPA